MGGKRRRREAGATYYVVDAVGGTASLYSSAERYRDGVPLTHYRRKLFVSDGVRDKANTLIIASFPLGRFETWNRENPLHGGKH